MAGYSRQSAGSIVTSAVISAASHNAEYNAVQAAFDANSGHKHDGTTSEGAPITVTGPAQDFTFSGASVTPKTTNVYSLGTTGLRFSSGWFQGAVTAAGGFIGNVTGNLTGNLATARTISVGTDATGGVSFNGSANVTIPLTLNNVNGNVGTFGGADAGMTIIANAKGLITGIANTTSNRVMRAGDTMTGTLTGTRFALDTNTYYANSGTSVMNQYDSNDYESYDKSINNKYLVINNVAVMTHSATAMTSTVPITLPSDPTSNLHAATKQYVDSAAFSATIGYTPVQQGGGGGQLTNKVYIGWSGARLKAQVDSSDLGNIVFDTQLSSYLPLSGGNLTGALSSTSYSTTGAITADSVTTSGNLQSGTGTAGAVFLGGTGRFVQWNGTEFVFGGTGGGNAWHTGNFAPSNYAALTGAAFSGAISATTGGFSGRVTSLAPNNGAGGYAWTSATDRVSSFSIDASANLTFTIDGAARGITTFASDSRLKEDIAPATEEVLPLLKQIDFVDFRFKPLSGNPPDYVMPMQRGGIIAQQIQTIKPEWVSEFYDPDKTLIPNVQLLLTNALKAIVELSDKVDSLQAEVNTLKAIG